MIKISQNKLIKAVKKPIKKLLNRIPVTLPIGVMEFNKFVDDILETYDIPQNRSYRNSIAVMILHLEKGTHKASKYEFYSALKRAQAAQTADHMMREYHKELDAEREKDKIKDITPPKDGPSLVESISK